jgi:hypothetical protein
MTFREAEQRFLLLFWQKKNTITPMSSLKATTNPRQPIDVLEAGQQRVNQAVLVQTTL